MVFFHDFADEREAIEYAIASQRNRRNLTEAEIARCILALDRVGTKGGNRGNRYTASKASPDALLDSPTKSAKVTARLVGANTTKVEHLRRVAREAPDLLQDVLDGKKMVSRAHNELLERNGTPYVRSSPPPKPKQINRIGVHPSFLNQSTSTDVSTEAARVHPCARAASGLISPRLPPSSMGRTGSHRAVAWPGTGTALMGPRCSLWISVGEGP